MERARVLGSFNGGPHLRGPHSIASWRRWSRVVKLVLLVWVAFAYIWLMSFSNGTKGHTSLSQPPQGEQGQEQERPTLPDVGEKRRSGEGEALGNGDARDELDNVLPPTAPDPSAAAAMQQQQSVQRIARAPTTALQEDDPELGWPLPHQRLSQAWLFLFCASRTKNVLRTSTGFLQPLMEASIELDFRVLACDPMHEDSDTTVYHERLHYLPASARRKLLDEEANGALEFAFRGSAAGGTVVQRATALGVHGALHDILSRVDGRHFLMMSPNVRLGADRAEVVARLTQLLRLPHPTDRFDERVFVPRVLLQPDDQADDAGGGAPSDAAASGSAPRVPTSALSILSHGLQLAEVQGGRVTFFPRYAGLSGAELRDMSPVPRGGAGLPEVDLPTGLCSLFSLQKLRDRLDSFVRAGGLRGFVSQKKTDEELHHSALRRIGAERTPEFLVDLALAMLLLPKPRAAPVSVTYIAFAGLEYVEELAAVGAGGRHIKFTGSEDLFGDLDRYLPPELSASAAWRRVVRRRYTQPLGNTVNLYWDPYCSCTGINIEAINFLVPLERYLSVRAVANADCWCRGFPAGDQMALQRLMKAKNGSGVEVFQTTTQHQHKQQQQQQQLGAAVGHHFDSTKASIWVTHKPVDAFPTFPYHGAIDFPQRPTYIIGRTMIEVDRISESWVRTLNNDKLVDEIWVPSQFLVDCFYDSGVKAARKIFVIPEAIDVNVYDPALHPPGGESASGAGAARRPDSNRLLDQASHEKFQFFGSSDGARLGAAARRKASRPANTEFAHLCPECFRFFSNFKWERRKGWDVLLTAYFSEFSREDKVILFIKTYLYLDPRPRDVNRITRKIQDYGRGMGKDIKELPQFVVLAEETDAASMPALYAQMDCFVLPTRGEGWGLPLQEAMAMGLPTIGTRWGGNMEFMTEQNSMLLGIEGTEVAGQGFAGSAAGGVEYPGMDDLKDIAPEGAQPQQRSERSVDLAHMPGRQGRKRNDDGRPHNSGHRQRAPHWARPSVKHLRRLMRWVMENPEQGAALGREGRRTMVERYSREAVAEVVAARLAKIRDEDPRFQDL